MYQNKKGFTLIELLVVIAIIGLLSSMAVVNLNSARGKARDAKRISDVKQLSLLIEIAATSNAIGNFLNVLPAGCQSEGSLTTGCGTSFQDVDWTDITDPSGSSSACHDNSAAPCAYSMGIDNTVTDSYEICFYLEEGAGSVAAGVNSVTPGGKINPGCSYAQ